MLRADIPGQFLPVAHNNMKPVALRVRPNEVSDGRISATTETGMLPHVLRWLGERHPDLPVESLTIAGVPYGRENHRLPVIGSGVSLVNKDALRSVAQSALFVPGAGGPQFNQDLDPRVRMAYAKRYHHESDQLQVRKMKDKILRRYVDEHGELPDPEHFDQLVQHHMETNPPPTTRWAKLDETNKNLGAGTVAGLFMSTAHLANLSRLAAIPDTARMSQPGNAVGALGQWSAVLGAFGRQTANEYKRSDDLADQINATNYGSAKYESFPLDVSSSKNAEGQIVITRGYTGKTARMDPVTKRRLDSVEGAGAHNRYVEEYERLHGRVPEGDVGDITAAALEWDQGQREAAAQERAQRAAEKRAKKEAAAKARQENREMSKKSKIRVTARDLRKDVEKFLNKHGDSLPEDHRAALSQALDHLRANGGTATRIEHVEDFDALRESTQKLKDIHGKVKRHLDVAARRDAEAAKAEADAAKKETKSRGRTSKDKKETATSPSGPPTWSRPGLSRLNPSQFVRTEVVDEEGNRVVKSFVPARKQKNRSAENGPGTFVHAARTANKYNGMAGDDLFFAQEHAEHGPVLVFTGDKEFMPQITSQLKEKNYKVLHESDPGLRT